VEAVVRSGATRLTLRRAVKHSDATRLTLGRAVKSIFALKRVVEH